MAANPTLKVEKRTVLGRRVKQLRRQGNLPANVYGKKIDSIAVTVTETTFVKLYDQVGDTGLIDLQIGDETKTRPVLVGRIHYDPETDSPLHVDFRQVDLAEKVTALVPVEIVGEAPAVKDHGGVLITSLSEIEVEALPQDLPDKFEIDVSGLTELNDLILVRDIKVNQTKVTILADEETAVLSIQPPKAEEEEPEPVEEGETETESGNDGDKTEAAESTEESKPEEE